MEEMIFLHPGDLVVLKHKVIKSPIMLVLEKKTRQYKDGDEIQNQFLGMLCGWFDKNQVWQTATFSTKDLVVYK